MTYKEFEPIAVYFNTEAVTRKDVKNNPLMSTFSDRYLKVFSTITRFGLKEEQARELAFSSKVRQADEDYKSYRLRLRARDSFMQHYKGVFKEMSKKPFATIPE